MDVDGTLVGMLAALLGPAAAMLMPFWHRRAMLAPWRIGHAHLAEQRFVEAEAQFRVTLPLAERRFGRDHWRTALHLNALALSLVGQDRLDEAEPLVERALRIVEAPVSLPAERAVVLMGASVYAGARGDQERAVELVERARLASGRNTEVRGYIERTAAARASRDGDDVAAADAYAKIPSEFLAQHDVGRLGRLGVARLRAGDAVRAVQCLRRALETAARGGTGEFPEAFLRGLLGEALARSGHELEARRALEQAVVDYDAVAGERHPAVAPVLVELAELRERAGNLDGARHACQRVLALPGRPVDTAIPYRTSEAADDPIRRERERAHALLARIGT